MHRAGVVTLRGPTGVPGPWAPEAALPGATSLPCWPPEGAGHAVDRRPLCPARHRLHTGGAQPPRGPASAATLRATLTFRVFPRAKGRAQAGARGGGAEEVGMTQRFRGREKGQ